MWVVLTGPSATTVGKALARRLGWDFDDAVERMSCLDDAFQLELKRDTQKAGTFRVIVSWHFGIAARAFHQPYRKDVVNEILDSARKAAKVETVLCCSLDGDGDDGRHECCVGFGLPLASKVGTNADAFESAATIGKTAEAVACNVLGNRFFSAGCLANQSVAAVVERLQGKLLEFVVGPTAAFHSFQQAARRVLLSASKVLPELQMIVPLDSLDLAFAGVDRDVKYPCFVVVVEGLDGSGKSTLVKRLKRHCGSNAVQSQSPSETLTNARAFFEKDSKAGFDKELRNSFAFKRLKRAFFTFGNYLLASELLDSKRSTSCSPVIIDRFASSTIAYTLESIDADSSAGVQLFWRVVDFVLPRAKWPADLPHPDIVLLLDAAEVIRRERILNRSLGRSVGIGEWEKAFGRNRRLAPAISHHLQTIQAGPPLEIIDTNRDDVDVVFRCAARKLMNYGVAFAFRQVVDEATCEAILHDFHEASQGRLAPGSLHRYKWENTNTEYASGRHRNVGVCFLETEDLQTKTIPTICQSLEQTTDLTGWAVEDGILPVFR